MGNRDEQREPIVDREGGRRFMQKARSVLYVPLIVTMVLFTLVVAPWSVLVVLGGIALVLFLLDRAFFGLMNAEERPPERGDADRERDGR